VYLVGPVAHREYVRRRSLSVQQHGVY